MSKEKELSYSTFQNDLEMLKFFHDEFIYHHELFWKLLIKLTILSVVVTILPLTSEIFGVKLDNISQEARFFFLFWVYWFPSLV